MDKKEYTGELPTLPETNWSHLNGVQKRPLWGADQVDRIRRAAVAHVLAQATGDVKTWGERMPAPRKQKYCAMNCSPKPSEPCEDCETETVYGNPIQARDAEISDLRIALAQSESKLQALQSAYAILEKGYAQQEEVLAQSRCDRNVVLEEVAEFQYKRSCERHGYDKYADANAIRSMKAQQPAQAEQAGLTDAEVFDLFRKNCVDYPGNYEVTPGQALNIYRAIAAHVAKGGAK